jgi:MFS family permease
MTERAVVRLTGQLLVLESALYGAVAPLLPHYAHVLHVSKAAAGVLTGCYAAGLLPGSVLGACLIPRIGVRRTTVVGLAGFAVAIGAFGFASSILLLDALRVMQGIAAAVIWSGALTWVMAVAPEARRGEVLGSAIGAAVVGTVLGPLIGTVAVATRTEATFAVGSLRSDCRERRCCSCYCRCRPTRWRWRCWACSPSLFRLASASFRRPRC